MSITPIKVRIVKRPIIKARFVPQLPANLTGRTAIAVERNGSIYYVDLDYAKLFETTVFDPATTVIAILNADGTWNKTTIASLSTMIGADKPNLVAIANAATAADKLGWWSGEAQYSLTDFTAYMRTLLDDPDASTARQTLGLVIGTDVQPHDAELDALAGLVSAADRLPYFTGPGTAALTVLTPFARTLLDDADAATMRATIDAQQRDSDLDAIAALTPADNDFIQRKAGAWVNRSIAQVKTDLAINNVDNTSDLNKPISTATQGALDLKSDKATTVSAGTGLTGGGDLSANRSVALSSASIASLGKADTAVQPARAVNTGTGLTGGGDLSADRTIALDAASQASLAKADTAVQPADLGALAVKSQIDVPGDINATGTPSSSTYLRGDGTWAAGGGGGGGDLLAANNLSDLDDADTALDNLGGTTTGKAVFTAVDQAGARAAIAIPRRYIGFYNGQGPNTTPASVYNIGVADAVDPKSWGRRGITAPTWDQAATYKDNNGRQSPYPVRVGNRIFVYYEGYNGTNKAIFLEIYDLNGGLAEKPILPIIANNAVAGSATVMRPNVLYEPDDDPTWPFKMLFSRAVSGTTPTAIHAARSKDGVSWSLLGDVLAPSSGWESTYLATTGRLVKDGATYRLFYDGHDGSFWQSGEINNTVFGASGWSKNPLNPILERRGGYNVPLTADVLSTPRTVKVANSALFDVGAPIAVYQTGGGFAMNRIAAIPDSTTLTTLFEFEGAYTVAAGAKVSQIHGGSHILSDVWFEDGVWKAFTTCYQFVSGQLVETVGYAETPNLSTKFTVQADVWPLPLNNKLKTWDQVSSENLKMIRLQ